jgi:hypothetical protein
MYTQELKDRACMLRKLGYSLKEIAHELSIAKSTASKWVLNIELGSAAKEKIFQKQNQGRRNSFSSLQLKRQKTYNSISSIVNKDLKSFVGNKLTTRLLCSFLYWGEGGKTDSCFRFTNSDPLMIRTFLHLFRSGFIPNETKFGATLHLHDYHNQEAQLQFWSKMTKIPKHKIGIYLKPHTGKNKRNGYQGCITVCYYDVKLFKALTSYYMSFARKLGA